MSHKKTFSHWLRVWREVIERVSSSCTLCQRAHLAENQRRQLCSRCTTCFHINRYAQWALFRTSFAYEIRIEMSRRWMTWRNRVKSETRMNGMLITRKRETWSSLTLVIKSTTSSSRSFSRRELSSQEETTIQSALAVVFYDMPLLLTGSYCRGSLEGGNLDDGYCQEYECRDILGEEQEFLSLPRNSSC